MGKCSQILEDLEPADRWAVLSYLQDKYGRPLMKAMPTNANAPEAMRRLYTNDD